MATLPAVPVDTDSRFRVGEKDLLNVTFEGHYYA